MLLGGIEQLQYVGTFEEVVLENAVPRVMVAPVGGDELRRNCCQGARPDFNRRGLSLAGLSKLGQLLQEDLKRETILRYANVPFSSRDPMSFLPV